MPDALNFLISIGAEDTGRASYPVQLHCDGTPRAEDWVSIDRAALLEDEHNFSAQAYGMRLNDALFAGSLGRTYQRLIGAAGAGTAIRVRLAIHPDAPELHALPWERLFHVFGDTEVPLAASARTPFSRFLITGAADQEPVADETLRLLVAIANPANLPPAMGEIDVAGEAAALADLVRDLGGRVAGTLLPGRSGLPMPLRQRLEREGWRIVDAVTSWANIQRSLPGQHALHILAHGQFKRSDRTAYLCLEAEGDDKVASGALCRVADYEIVSGLSGVHPLPQLIFLAACESARRPESGANAFVGLAPKLVEAGIPAVVAMQDLVAVKLAHTLTLDFYRRLFADGETAGAVDRALNEARNLAYQRNWFEWATPVLFLRLKDGRLFSAAKSPPLQPFEPVTVYVAAGTLPMAAEPGPQTPGGEVRSRPAVLPAFRIGKYPVTVREYAEFIKRERAQQAPNDKWRLREPPSKLLDHPVTEVSWSDAVAYCRWLSAATGRRYRLPTAAEWEKAATGVDRRRFPWGDEWDPTRVNASSPGTTPVARHPAGASPYGCEDMLGNVQEWTATLWKDDPDSSQAWAEPPIFDPGDLPPQAWMVHKGGSYLSRPEELACEARAGALHTSKIPWRGFRVVMEISGA